MADLVEIQRLIDKIVDEIAVDPTSKDSYRLERIADEMFASLMTRRRDQQRLADEYRALAERMSRDEWSMRADAGPLRLVKDNGDAA